MIDESKGKYAPWYWAWNKGIPAEVCQLVLSEVEKNTFEEARVGLNGTTRLDAGLRKGKVNFLQQQHWFEGVLSQFVMYANNAAGWNFNLQGFEPIQVASYEKDELYDWHPDDDILSRNKPMQRKLSIVCQLSKAEDFEGGGLFIKDVEESVLKNQGDVVVFPAYMLHKAATVTSGKRVTAVCWSLGDYFK